MVYGIEIIDGVAFVKAYDGITDIPKNHIMKRPEELQDYLDKLTKGE